MLLLAVAVSVAESDLRPTQPPPSPPGGTEAVVDRLFTDYAERTHVPGAAWGVVVDGQLAHAGVVRRARRHDERAPVDADTVFRIASMTKSFTAMSILKLRDEGKLSLDDPAEKYVPELKALEVPDDRFAEHHDPASAVALRRISRKTTRGAISSSPTPTSSCRRCCAPAFRSRTRPASRTSTRTMASRSSAASSRTCRGMPYAEYVAANILRPLGMTSTTLEPSKRAGQPSRARLSLGGRTQWKEEPQLPTDRSARWAAC